MKKVRMMYTIGVLSLLLSVNLTVSCADLIDGSNNAHTICYEYANPNSTVGNPQPISTTTTIHNCIAYDMTSDSYYGEFVCLYTSYEKSTLSVEYAIGDDESFDKADLHCICYGDHSGDMIRFIVEWLSDGTVVSSKTFAGVHIDEPQKELQYCLPFDNPADRLRVTVQARYYSAKGGSRTDSIRFDNLSVRFGKQSVIQEEYSDLSDDYTDYNIPDEQTSVTDDNDKKSCEPVDTEADNTDDMAENNPESDKNEFNGNNQDENIIDDLSNETGEIQSDMNSENEQVQVEDGTTDTDITEIPPAKQIFYDASNDCYYGEMTDLRTDYGKSSLSTGLFTANHIKDVLLECEICCDGSGDYVRFIVEFFDEKENLTDTQTLTGRLYPCSVWSLYQKNPIKPEKEYCYIRVIVQAKYESKKGGSKSDVVIFKNLRIR